MFHLLMSTKPWEPSGDTFVASRVFEYTDPELIARFMPSGTLNREEVARLPALLANETRYDNSQSAARVATISRVRLVGGNYSLEYNIDHNVQAIQNSTLAKMASELGIVPTEFSRTHWSIKDADLYKSIVRQGLSSRPQSKIFSLSETQMDDDLVAVMMPFVGNFSSVYAALRGAITAVGMKCHRADDIWEHDHIIQDVVSLICRARIVICDMSGRNANVFYETGIAHAFGRDVILITQAPGDVPFDVGHIRHIQYHNNGEGLAKLTADVEGRLATLKSRR